MLKTALLFAKNVFINVERGYKPTGVLRSSKTHYYGQILNVEVREVRAANAQTQLDLFQEVVGEFCDSLENKDQIIRSTFINIKNLMSDRCAVQKKCNNLFIEFRKNILKNA